MEACGSRDGWGEYKKRSHESRFPEAVAIWETAPDPQWSGSPCVAEEPSSRRCPSFPLPAAAAFLKNMFGAWLGGVGLLLVLLRAPEFPLPEQSSQQAGQRVTGSTPCEWRRCWCPAARAIVQAEVRGGGGEQGGAGNEFMASAECLEV